MRLFTCNNCDKIHLEVSNILIHFNNKEQLSTFCKYLDEIDAQSFSDVNSHLVFSKQIFLPVPGTNINMAFTISEFNRLRHIIREYMDRNYFVELRHRNLKMPYIALN